MIIGITRGCIKTCKKYIAMIIGILRGCICTCIKTDVPLAHLTNFVSDNYSNAADLSCRTQLSEVLYRSQIITKCSPRRLK